jgi:hypothetical protein
MTPKQVRLKLDIETACYIDDGDKYKELLDIVIDELGVRHIEKIEDKVYAIVEKFRDFEAVAKMMANMGKDKGNHNVS